MSVLVTDLTSDQLRRIFRDYLKGVPKERLTKKYDIPEGVFWDVVGMYSKNKHPNDVGNAQDIKGPADLLVSSMDTGATATEHPIVARNPKDMRVDLTAAPEPFDYNSPEEELRKKGGEVGELIAKREADKSKKLREDAAEMLENNKESTDAIFKELSEVSETETKSTAAEAAKAAKAGRAVDDLTREAREAVENQQRAENAGEVLRALSNKEWAEEHAEDDQKRLEKAKEEEKKNKEDTLTAQKESDEELMKQAKDIQKEADREARKASDASSNVGGSDGESARSDRQTPSAREDRSGAEKGNKVTRAVPEQNTSKTAQPNAVEPSKVLPNSIKGK